MRNPYRHPVTQPIPHWQRTLVVLAVLALLVTVSPTRADEPPAINPFGPQTTNTRDDVYPGYIETSDGRVVAGMIYLTRDKRLKTYDQEMERQREVPLRVVKQIDCHVQKEWMEKEWRFKELASNEKYYTGREYPAREYLHTITLQDDRKISGPLSGIIYIEPGKYDPDDPRAYRPEVKPERFLLHKRDKGEIGEDLESLLYVKTIKLGDDAYEEGRRKAARYRPRRSKTSSRRSNR